MTTKTEKDASMGSRMKFELDSKMQEIEIVQEELDHTKNILEACRRLGTSLLPRSGRRKYSHR
jgi:hypothetical protein